MHAAGNYKLCALTHAGIKVNCFLDIQVGEIWGANMDFLKVERLRPSCPFTSDAYALIYIKVLYLVTYVQLLKQL